ncbi:MAG: T9SS type A sorting domain-containing protein [Crocinitomicaceae bacterium]|nr:T9SS type A sorting domain-containing protein [Crocinitomicaceae bacterium]
MASTSLNNGLTWDDPYFNVPIGFTFEYFGESTTTIDISDDGLGGILSVGDCAIDPTFSYLVAYGTDIIDRGYDGAASLSNISYKTEGTAGSRICKIEWNNVGFYSGTNDMNGDRIDFLNFQLWLYETSNAVEIRFGPKSITEPSIDFEGETGSFVVLAHDIDCASSDIFGHQLMLSGSPGNPDFYDNVYNLEDTLVFLDGAIPPFMVYRFVPESTASQDELSAVAPFSIVPNPADFELRLLKGEGAEEEIRRASIVDLNGKLLVNNLEFNQAISIAGLQSGMYFVQVEMKSGEMYSEKFTKR